MPAEEYDELSKLCDRLLTQQEKLQEEVRKQAEMLKVSNLDVQCGGCSTTIAVGGGTWVNVSVCALECACVSSQGFLLSNQLATANSILCGCLCSLPFCLVPTFTLYLQALNKGKPGAAAGGAGSARSAAAARGPTKAGAAALGVSPTKLISRSKSAVNPSRAARAGGAEERDSLGIRPLPGMFFGGCGGLFSCAVLWLALLHPSTVCPLNGFRVIVFNLYLHSLLLIYH